MEVDGKEVYRKEPGRDAVHTHIKLTAGKKVPFEITYLTDQANGLGWIARIDIPGTLAMCSNRLDTGRRIQVCALLRLANGCGRG